MNILRCSHRSPKLYFMFVLLGLSLLGFGLTSIAQAQSAPEGTMPFSGVAATGFHVSGRYLLDANDNNFIMRGVNHGHNWYLGETSSFANIKAKGANTVRVVLSSGQNWPKDDVSDVANVVGLCKTNKLICVLEVHDTTGYGEDAGAISLAEAVTYWKEIQSALDGQEAYVIINIGNEPYGNINASNWVDDTKNAIAALRNAGFQHTLMIDAPDWGQDWEHIMLNNASNVLASDPNSNLIFSIHMYEVYETSASIQNYVSTFVNKGLPLVIGEFGWKHSDGDPDEDAIMSIAQANGIGYMGWVWSGDSYLNIVTNFDPNQETWWGNRIIHGKDGLMETSCEASVYGDGLHLKLCFSARSVGVQDGWILESTEASGVGGTLNTSATTLNLGDDAANKQYRSILSFNTKGLPDNAVITKVMLKVRKQGIIGGGNPVTTFQGFMVDIRKGFFGTITGLVNSDFQAAASKSYGPYKPVPVSGWYSIDMTSAKAYINKLTTGGGLTQIRLRFKLDDNNNFVANYLKLYSGNAIDVANRPQLVIEYYIP